MTQYQPSVQRFREELIEMHSTNAFVVFLCGPTLNDCSKKPSSKLRKRLKEELEENDFEVILGEDDGLIKLGEQFKGMAHENELRFIEKESGAVVLIADSVGSFCELGLFSYTHYTQNENNVDFILILNEEFENADNYLNAGPKTAIKNMGGEVIYGNFKHFDTDPIIKRLQIRRSVWFNHGKGKPKSS